MPINACVRPAALIFLEADIERCHVQGQVSPFVDILQKFTEMRNGFVGIIALSQPANEETLPSDYPERLLLLHSVSSLQELCWAIKDPDFPLRSVEFDRMLLVTMRPWSAQIAEEYGFQTMFAPTLARLQACEQELCELAKLHY